jgi:hypothetical protein
MPLHAPETARVAPTPVTPKTNRCFSSMGVRISERPLSVLLCLFIDLKKKRRLGLPFVDSSAIQPKRL